ncbi:MAG TPA: hypothetical protein VGN53_10160 [Klebsiella sp.]|jgi:hypothetical protein
MADLLQSDRYVSVSYWIEKLQIVAVVCTGSLVYVIHGVVNLIKKALPHAEERLLYQTVN